ncbi:MAG: NADH-quinone oxidoreductase subunit C [Phycisphaerae bacterium]
MNTSTYRETMPSMTSGNAVQRVDIPVNPLSVFQDTIAGAVAGENCRVVTHFGLPDPANHDLILLYTVLAHDHSGRLHIAAAAAPRSGYPSLTPRCPQMHLFERQIAENLGVPLYGHPWLKPVAFPGGIRHKTASHPEAIRAADPIGLMNFYHIDGGQVHEVAVGPIHAGVIEPGHFRFQCDGETILHLEISLGYQHRGVQRALKGGPNKRSWHYAETLCGDSTIAHGCAYAQNVEALASCRVSPRAAAIRGIALELERIANHVGDLGGLAKDAAFLPTASFCGRIRGDFLNMTALICGNRFGRGLVKAGGIGFDIDDQLRAELLRKLADAQQDLVPTVDLLWSTPSVTARFEHTGILPRATAIELGVVGVAARACSIDMDSRRDHPSGIYRFTHLPVVTAQGGDVLARAYVRGMEIQHSIAFVREQLQSLPTGEHFTPPAPLQPGMFAVSLQESWRGELCHVVLTDAAGRFEHYNITDPSIHNWFGLAMAMRGGQISDFPICNKSFGLSYCGCDL